MTTLHQDWGGEAPQSIQLVASADYKSVDPDTHDIVLPADTRAFSVNLNVTAATGGGGVTVTISGWDEGSGTWQSLLVSALKAGVAFSQLKVTPDLTASANVLAQVHVPKKIRVACVGSGTRTTLNYSVGLDAHQ